MAENTRLKELSSDVKRNAEAIEKLSNDIHEQMSRLGIANSSRFEQLEAMQMNTESKFSQTTSALDMLLNQSPQRKTHGAGNSNKQSFQVRNIKLEFPRFDGNNVLEWIFRAEQFFDYYDTPDLDRLTIAFVHLDKDVVPWFQMMQRSHPFHSWAEFTRALELDFGPSIYECPRATLFKLQQTGTVADYLHFTSLANRVYGLSNDALVDCFISGLNAEIKRDVMIHTPISIVKAASLAKVYEDKYSSSHKPQKTTPLTSYTHRATFNSNKPDQYHKPPHTLLLPTPPTRPMNPNQQNPNIKCISSAEMQLRREKGLCYWCDEKFSLAHKCPNRQVMMLQIDDGEDEIVKDPDNNQPHMTPHEIELPTNDHHLSLNAMKGTSSMGILRFTGQIGHISAQVLVDGGSSDNFLQPRIAEFLKLPIEPGPCVNVLVGNGQTMTAEGMVPNLTITVQGHNLHVPVLLLPVAGANIILGASWLATLGPHIVDYAALTLKFFCQRKFITLQGEKEASPKLSQLHHFKRMLNTDAIAESFTVQLL